MTYVLQVPEDQVLLIQLRKTNTHLIVIGIYTLQLYGVQQ